MKIAYKLFGMACSLLALPLSGQTLDACQQAAQANYPLLKRQSLIEQTTALNIDNINKGWLPQVQATAQATLQSETVSLPSALSNMMTQQGYTIKGLRKDQYKLGVDVAQTVYDGGQIKQQKAIAQQQGLVQEVQNEVTMYQVRQRVNALYFGILLVEEKLQLNAELQKLLEANEVQLASMFKGGTASESDYNAIRAERLTAVQSATELQSQRTALRRMLGIFTNLEISTLVKPAPYLAKTESRRPELKLYTQQLELTNLQERTLDLNLRPRLSAFASGFYGYPGYNMYQAMMDGEWTLNGMIGLKLSWNISPLYTRKNDKRKLALQRSAILNDQEIFLFNNKLEQTQQEENMAKYRQLLNEDNSIIDLRSKVRQSSESKLRHGIININDLIKEIHNENTAKLQRSMHELQLLQEMYDLQFTQNN